MPDDADRPKLPVLDIALKSYIFTFQSYVIFLKWLLPAILFVAIIEIPISILFSEYGALPGFVVISTLYLALWPVPVIISRNILLGETAVPRYIGVFSRNYYWQYVVAALFISLLILSGTVIPKHSILYLDLARPGHTNIAAFALVLLAMILIGRFLLVLPMKAVGHDGWAIRSWRISKGNTLRLAAILLLTNIFPYFLGIIVRKLLENIGRDDRELLSMLFDTVENLVANTLIGVLDLSLNACALAYAYRVLTETKPNEQV